jgi:acylphosphatase
VIRRHVIVLGRVQGVFFRDGCRREADILGVRGWIANRSDGSVEAVFEGDAGAVDEIVDWCREGPAQADVSRVDVQSEEPEGIGGFEVRD